MFSQEEISDNEKIDFIYKRLKAEQRMSQIKMIAIIMGIICVYLGVQFLARPESEPIKKKAMLFAQEKIATFVSPIVSGILDSVMADMMNKSQNTGVEKESSETGTVWAPVRTWNSRPSQRVAPDELPIVSWVQITPEMIDTVHSSLGK
jgi:hypothetical protein